MKKKCGGVQNTSVPNELMTVFTLVIYQLNMINGKLNKIHSKQKGRLKVISKQKQSLKSIKERLSSLKGNLKQVFALKEKCLQSKYMKSSNRMFRWPGIWGDWLNKDVIIYYTSISCYFIVPDCNLLKPIIRFKATRRIPLIFSIQ